MIAVDSVDGIVREGSSADVTFELQPKWKDGVGHELECRRQREQQGKGPEAGVSLVSHSFEPICLKTGGKLVHSEGKGWRKEGKARRWSGPRSYWSLQAPGDKCTGIGDLGEQPHTASREGQAPGPARKGPGKASLPTG